MQSLLHHGLLHPAVLGVQARTSGPPERVRPALPYLQSCVT